MGSSQQDLGGSWFLKLQKTGEYEDKEGNSGLLARQESGESLWVLYGVAGLRGSRGGTRKNKAIEEKKDWKATSRRQKGRRKKKRVLLGMEDRGHNKMQGFDS